LNSKIKWITNIILECDIKVVHNRPSGS